VGSIIQRAAQTYDLNPNLIAAVINAESNFDTNAVSHAGAQGLMQLMPATAAELGVRDSFDPEQNIMGASRYLKGLVDRYDGDLSLALAAYNWGMGNVERHPGRLPSETSNYIAKVLAMIPTQNGGDFETEGRSEVVSAKQASYMKKT
jgi:soluble lytic murein transglycosylase-like protein